MGLGLASTRGVIRNRVASVLSVVELTGERSVLLLTTIILLAQYEDFYVALVIG